jgi:hypothetical protein
MAALAIVCLLPCRPAAAQMRLSDHDLERMMKNLHEDAKDFRSAFDASVHKSAIRNNSQDKDARALAEQFEKQTDELYKHFKGSKQADAYVWPVVRTAGQLDHLVYSLGLDSKTTLSWEKSRSEIHQIATSYGVAEPYLQSSSPVSSAAEPEACIASVGAAQARRLVERCTQVSPATHPPCNVQNSCALITAEIRRGCGLLTGAGAPGFCSEYQ